MQDVVEIGEPQIPHAEDVRLTRGARRARVHVNGNELIVHRGVAVPMRQIGGSLEHRSFLPRRH